MSNASRPASALVSRLETIERVINHAIDKLYTVPGQVYVELTETTAQSIREWAREAAAALSRGGSSPEKEEHMHDEIPQDRHRKETERREKVVAAAPIWVRGVRPDEFNAPDNRGDPFRLHIWHSCRDEGKGEMGGINNLALAISEVAQLRGAAIVAYSRSDGFEIHPYGGWGSSTGETPDYRNVWIVTNYIGGGIRGVFDCQSRAEAWIANMRREYPDMARTDFTVHVQRIQGAALSAPSSPLVPGERERLHDIIDRCTAVIDPERDPQLTADIDAVLLPCNGAGHCVALSSPSPLPADYETNPRACRQCGLSLAACFRWRGGPCPQRCCGACDHAAAPTGRTFKFEVENGAVKVSSSRATPPPCGVIGEPDAGRCVCELPKGHDGYHQQGRVHWLGYSPVIAHGLSPSAYPPVTPDRRTAVMADETIAISDRRLDDHHDGHGLNESIALTTDAPDQSGAAHLYTARIGDLDVARVQFQQGPRHEPTSTPGMTDAAVLAILIDRLRGFQAGPYNCRENAIILTHLEECLHWTKARADARARRGVLGQWAK